MPLSSLVSKIVKMNRNIVHTFTGVFYTLGCLLMWFYGVAAIAPKPISFQPDIPAWEAKLLLWGGIIAILSFWMYVVDQVVMSIREQIKARKERNALY